MGTIGLCQDIVSCVQTTRLHKNVSISVEAAKHFPYVKIPEVLVQQTIANAVINAAKCTTSGLIKISLQIQPAKLSGDDRQQGSDLVIAVQDTGILHCRALSLRVLICHYIICRARDD